MNKTKTALARINFLVAVVLSLTLAPSALVNADGATATQPESNLQVILIAGLIAAYTWASFMALYLTTRKAQR